MPLGRPPVRFGPFSLHPTEGLTLGAREVHVTPKSLAVLHSLTGRAGQLVTKEELFGDVWAGTPVSDAALSSCIRELRRALEDDARRPRYIETVHRRGFRFIAPCDDRYREQPGLLTAPEAQFQGPLPGHAVALARLMQLADEVLDGRSRIALVTGEAGIGKSSLIGSFVAAIARRQAWRVCVTECHHESAAELAYQPLLEALGQLCAQPEGAEVISVLRRSAPAWLAELPAFQTPDELRALRRRTGGATPGRLLVELADALAKLSAPTPLALWIEDLHWADTPTLEWLRWFAHQPNGAPVLVVASCQQDACETAAGAAILRELCGAGHCASIPLQRLDRGAIIELVNLVLPPPSAGNGATVAVAEHVFRATRGLPLTTREMLDGMTGSARLRAGRGRRGNGDSSAPAPCEAALPQDPGQARQWRLGSLARRERELLRVASIAGVRFTAEEVAAGAGITSLDAEATLRELAQRQAFILSDVAADWPDGTVTPRFRFAHQTYRETFLQELASMQQALVHRRIARRLHEGFKDHAPEISARLARHYEFGGDLWQAISCLDTCSATNRRRGAHELSLRHLRRALALLEGLPDDPRRIGREVLLRIAVGSELIAARGFRSAGVDEYYGRALALHRQIADEAVLGDALWGLWVFYLNRGPLGTAEELAQRLLEIARQLDDPALHLRAHHAQWGTALMRGNFDAVSVHTRMAMALCGAGMDETLGMTDGCTLCDAHLKNHHAAVCAGLFGAWADALTGRAESAARGIDQAVTHARDIRHPYTLALALALAAGVHASMHHAAAARSRASEARAIAGDHGFELLGAWAMIYEGWALAWLGDSRQGLEMLQAGLALAGEEGVGLFRPLQLALAAEVQLYSGRLDEATGSLEEAFAIAAQVGEGLSAAERYRVRGELSRRRSLDPEAESDLRSAMRIARGQGAMLFAERASDSLGA